MNIGKFRMEIQYDMKCSRFGEYRSNIGWLTWSLAVKPTAADLRKEGWTIKDGQQLCPRCSGNGDKESE